MKHLFKLLPFILALTILSACTKEFDVIGKEKVIVLRSKAFSDIEVSDNVSSRTIQPDLGMIITDFPSKYYYAAYTYGKNSSNDQLGERIDWNGSFTVSQDTTTLVFGTSTEYFFLFVKNLTSNSYGPITVNYGNSDSKTENISIPANNGTTYQIAYYKVHYNTKIRFQDLNNSLSYITLTAGHDFNFPNEENQCVVVNITSKESLTITHEIPESFSHVNKLNF